MSYYQVLVTFWWSIGTSDEVYTSQDDSNTKRKKHYQNMGCAVATTIYITAALPIDVNNPEPCSMDPTTEETEANNKKEK